MSSATPSHDWTCALRALPWVFVGLAVSAGCGSSDSDGDSTGATSCVGFAEAFPNVPALGASSAIDEAGFLDAYPKRACDVEEFCCQAAGKPFNRAYCEQEKAKTYETVSAQPYAVLDPVNAGRCLARLEQMKAACPVWGPLIAYVLGEDCGQVYKGQVAPGTGCSGAKVCAAPDGVHAYCVEQSDGTLRCETSSVDGQLGAECDPPTFASVRRGCAEGLQCDARTKMCVARCSDAGRACDWSLDCGLAYDCVEGRCVPGKAVGAACTGEGECASKSCVGGTCALDLELTCG